MSTTFEQWLAKVNDVVEKRNGLSVDDLCDAPLHDWYEDGVSPTVAALRTIHFSRGE